MGLLLFYSSHHLRIWPRQNCEWVWARCCEGTLEMPETWPLPPKSVGQKARHLHHNPTVGFEDLTLQALGFWDMEMQPWRRRLAGEGKSHAAWF